MTYRVPIANERLRFFQYIDHPVYSLAQINILAIVDSSIKTERLHNPGCVSRKRFFNVNAGSVAGEDSLIFVSTEFV
jgi:hypothetical protein